MELRAAVIKLAQEKPELRKHLVPLLRKEAGILDKLKKMFFKNPETGNKVKFDSLPADEQKKIRDKSNGGGWSSPQEDLDNRKKERAKKEETYHQHPKGSKFQKVEDLSPSYQDAYKGMGSKQDDVDEAFKIKDRSERTHAIVKIMDEWLESPKGKGYLNLKRIRERAGDAEDQRKINVTRKENEDRVWSRGQDQGRKDEDARNEQKKRDAPKETPKKKPEGYRQWTQGELNKI